MEKILAKELQGLPGKYNPPARLQKIVLQGTQIFGLHLNKKDKIHSQMMEDKRKQAGLLRNSTAKKARKKKEVLENTPGTNIPNRFDAEVVKFAIKWNTTVASLAEWMKMYGETIELVQQIQNPSDEQLNDFVSSADFYGINNKQVLPLLIQAAVLDQKYMIDTTRINITKVDKELAALIRPTWHTGNDPIKLNTLLTSADEGKVSVKVIRGYWF